MYAGFPPDLLGLLRCPVDHRALDLVEPRRADGLVVAGSLCCGGCGGRYPLRDGIAMLLEPELLAEKSRQERSIRDEISTRQYPVVAERSDSVGDRMEMIPTLRALAAAKGSRVLEYGCGTGRYTVPLVRAGATLLALDFSLASLQVLARRLPGARNVGLVQVDATRSCVAARSFARVLSTLVSNLPSREQRLAMLRAAAEALTDAGRLVFSTHHQNFVRRLLGRPPAGRYAECDIFRYFMQRDEVLRESRVYFRRVRCRPVQVFAPLRRRAGASALLLSRAAESLPFVRELGALLLVEAKQPIRVSGEGEAVRANRFAVAVHAFLRKARDAEAAGRPNSEREGRWVFPP